MTKYGQCLLKNLLELRTYSMGEIIAKFSEIYVHPRQLPCQVQSFKTKTYDKYQTRDQWA